MIQVNIAELFRRTADNLNPHSEQYWPEAPIETELRLIKASTWLPRFQTDERLGIIWLVSDVNLSVFAIPSSTSEADVSDWVEPAKINVTISRVLRVPMEFERNTYVLFLEPRPAGIIQSSTRYPDTRLALNADSLNLDFAPLASQVVFDGHAVSLAMGDYSADLAPSQDTLSDSSSPQPILDIGFVAADSPVAKTEITREDSTPHTQNRGAFRVDRLPAVFDGKLIRNMLQSLFDRHNSDGISTIGPERTGTSDSPPLDELADLAVASKQEHASVIPEINSDHGFDARISSLEDSRRQDDRISMSTSLRVVEETVTPHRNDSRQSTSNERRVSGAELQPYEISAAEEERRLQRDLRIRLTRRNEPSRMEEYPKATATQVGQFKSHRPRPRPPKKTQTAVVISTPSDSSVRHPAESNLQVLEHQNSPPTETSHRERIPTATSQVSHIEVIEERDMMPVIRSRYGQSAFFSALADLYDAKTGHLVAAPGRPNQFTNEN